MRWLKVVFAAVMVSAVTMMMAPGNAEALLRIGVEGRWVPLAEETMEEGGNEFSPDRHLGSSGIGVRGLLGFEFVAVGAKLNFTHHIFDQGSLNYTQFDINAHVRSAMPLTRVAFYVEAGPSIALNIGDVGFNGAVGMEVDLLGWPHAHLNLGLAAQYAEVSIGTGPNERRAHEGIRGLVTLGFDFTLHSGSD